jgi:hypothetical protein
MHRQTVSKKELRHFGFMVGGAFLLIGLWPMFLHKELPRFWALAIAALLILGGGVLPRALTPLQRGWMVIGNALGWLNTRIILGLVFYGMITPMGFAMRLLGKDPLRLRSPGVVGSYRVDRTPRERTHMLNLF